jgi:hypothetical protein
MAPALAKALVVWRARRDESATGLRRFRSPERL